MNSESTNVTLLVAMMLMGAACVFVLMHVKHGQTTTFADRIIAKAEQDRQDRRERIVRNLTTVVAGARLAVHR